MKTQVVICGALVVAVGAYRATVSNAPQHESAVKTASVPLAEQPTADATADGQVVARGEYLEVRRTVADRGSTGELATLAWSVREGSHLGVPLDGLAIVAVVFAEQTAATATMRSSRTTLLVDARADEAQRAALVAMAKALAPDATGDVETVKPVKIDMNVCRGCALGYASLVADTVTVRTRRIIDSDKRDGQTARPTLANVYFGRPAFTLEHSYWGYDLPGQPVAFNDPGASSAMVGGF